MPKLSVVIPVHNGGGRNKLTRTVKSILEQTCCDFELILVENGSMDHTWQICQKLQKQDSRIRIAQSELSTSFARKRGVELAEGEYITFCDCDDLYVNTMCFAKMVETAEKTQCDILQFGYYINRLGKITSNTTKELTIGREELLNSFIAGAMGAYKCVITPTNWDKVYKGAILKSAVSNIDEPMIKSVDIYVNSYAFFEASVKTVSFTPECFYVYRTGFGDSGAAGSGQKLFEEYQITKPIALDLAREHQCGKTVFVKCYREILNFLHALIVQFIISGQSKNEIVEEIRKYTSWNFVKEAAQFFLNDDKEWDGHIKRLSQIEDPEAYYNMCLSDVGNLPLKKTQYQVKWAIKKTLRWVDRL